MTTAARKSDTAQAVGAQRMSNIKTRMDAGTITATVTLRIGWSVSIGVDRGEHVLASAGHGHGAAIWTKPFRALAARHAKKLKRCGVCIPHVVPVLTMDTITLPARFLKQKAAKGAKEARR